MRVTEVDIDSVRPYAGNPRINSAAVDVIAESIRNYGFRQPIVVDRDMVIVCGHTRWEAMRRLGMRTIPCVIADDLTPEQAMAYRLDDNRSAEFSSWDMGKLTEELGKLGDAGYDLSSLSFTSEELESLLGDDDGDKKSEDEEDDGDGENDAVCGDSGIDVREFGCVTLVLGASDDGSVVESALGGKSPSAVVYSLLMLSETFQDRLSLESHIVRKVERIADMAAPGTPFYAIADGSSIAAAVGSMPAFGVDVMGEVALPLAREVRLGGSLYDRSHVSVIYGWKRGGTPPFDGEGASSMPICSHPEWSHCPPECVTHTVSRHCGRDGVVANPLGGSGDVAVICLRVGQRCVSFHDDSDSFRAVCGRLAANGKG